MAPKKTVIFGSAGTGKTSTIIKVAKNLLTQIPPDHMAILTFSVTGAREIKNRLIREGIITDEKDETFKYLGRTIHSLFFRYYGLKTTSLLTGGEKAAFCKLINVSYELGADLKIEDLSDLEFQSQSKKRRLGNMLFEYFDKARQVSPENPKDSLPSEVEDNFNKERLSKDRIVEYYDKFVKYKQDIQKLDHTDYLLMALRDRVTFNFRCIIIDEFQDLSPLQYKLYRQISEGVDNIIIAGDDDQAIYHFMGCSPEFLLDERKAAEVKILDVSYRCPSKIINFGWDILDSLKGERQEKKVVSGSAKEGEIKILKGVLSFDAILNEIRGEVVFEAQTNRFVEAIERELKKRPIPYDIWRRNTRTWYTEDKFRDITNGLIELQKTGQTSHHIALRIALATTKTLKHGMKQQLTQLFSKNTTPLLDTKMITWSEFFNWFKYKTLYTLATPRETILADIISHIDYLKKTPFWEYYKTNIKIPSQIGVHISTFHQAKGREVGTPQSSLDGTAIVFNDISRITAERIKEDEDEYDQLVRSFYVAVTRTTDKLVIVEGFLDRNFTFTPYHHGN